MWPVLIGIGRAVGLRAGTRVGARALLGAARRTTGRYVRWFGGDGDGGEFSAAVRDSRRAMVDLAHTPPLTIRFSMDDGGASTTLRHAQRDVRRRAREGLKAAGEQVILPRVKLRGPGFVSSSLTIGISRGSGYVTTRGPRRLQRAVGLLNFGGTVTTPIRPKHKQALTVGDGVVAQVNTPRRYKGLHFIERGIEEGLPRLEGELLPHVMRAFEGLEHRP